MSATEHTDENAPSRPPPVPDNSLLLAMFSDLQKHLNENTKYLNELRAERAPNPSGSEEPPTPTSEEVLTPASEEAHTSDHIVSNASNNEDSNEDGISLFGGDDLEEGNDRLLDEIDESLRPHIH